MGYRVETVTYREEVHSNSLVRGGGQEDQVEGGGGGGSPLGQVNYRHSPEVMKK